MRSKQEEDQNNNVEGQKGGEFKCIRQAETENTGTEHRTPVVLGPPMSAARFHLILQSGLARHRQ